MIIDGFAIAWWIIALIAIALAAFSAIAIIWGIKAHKTKIAAGIEEMMGKKAIVRSPLKPKGEVFVEGELWAAISESGDIEAGREVIITNIDGLTLYVTRNV